jgi:hypothetical protein
VRAAIGAVSPMRTALRTMYLGRTAAEAAAAAESIAPAAATKKTMYLGLRRQQLSLRGSSTQPRRLSGVPRRSVDR